MFRNLKYKKQAIAEKKHKKIKANIVKAHIVKNKVKKYLNFYSTKNVK